MTNRADCNPATGKCYAYVSDPYSFSSARAYASAQGYNGQAGYLAAITTADEASWIAANVDGIGANFWVGARENLYLNDMQQVVHRYWAWATGPTRGLYVGFPDLGIAMPTGDTSFHCMTSLSGTWTVEDCEATHPVLIEWSCSGGFAWDMTGCVGLSSASVGIVAHSCRRDRSARLRQRKAVRGP